MRAESEGFVVVKPIVRHCAYLSRVGKTSSTIVTFPPSKSRGQMRPFLAEYNTIFCENRLDTCNSARARSRHPRPRLFVHSHANRSEPDFKAITDNKATLLPRRSATRQDGEASRKKARQASGRLELWNASHILYTEGADLR